MEIPQPTGGAVRPVLRLFGSDDAAETAAGDHSRLTPGMPYSAFYAQWFEPIVLEDASPGTLVSYRETVAWWSKLTSDPPIDRTDEFTIRTFKDGLKSATWRRGKLGAQRPLSKGTIAKHLKQMRAVIRRAGPTSDPNRPAKHLVDQVPHIRVQKPKFARKRAFTIEQAQLVVAGARHMPTPQRAVWDVAPPDWWRGMILVLFYTGLRIGTVLKLRYDMIAARHPDSGATGPWLIVPGEIVDKTSKPLDKFLHPAAVAWLDSIRTTRTLIFPWQHCRRHFIDRHERLQKLAGLPPAEWLSPHAWRRAHGTEMARVGARRGISIAQAALDHADERTTRESYVDIEPELIRQLPRIDALAQQLDGDRQLELF